ncbi:MAG: response regulator [Bauldia sp.]
MPQSSSALEERHAVFVVDDDPAVTHSLKFALELEGYTVVVFSLAADVLSAAFPESGCLLIDYKLPDMNGLDMLAKLRARGVTMPAVLITTAPGEALVRRAAAAGTPIVEKPFLSNALNQALDAMFERPHL